MRLFSRTRRRTDAGRVSRTWLKKYRPLVRWRTQVELAVARDLVQAGARLHLEKTSEIVAAQRLAGRQENVELHGHCARGQRVQLTFRQWRARDHQRRNAARRRQKQVTCRLGDAVREERAHGERHQPLDLAVRVPEIPAAHRHDARGGEVIEKHAPGFQGVERVLRQREAARVRGRPGVDQAHLDDVEALGMAREPAARLAVNQRDTRQPGNARVALERLPVL